MGLLVAIQQAVSPGNSLTYITKMYICIYTVYQITSTLQCKSTVTYLSHLPSQVGKILTKLRVTVKELLRTVLRGLYT